LKKNAAANWMVIVHDPAAEARFVGNGSGINRKTFMSNDFVILGPVSDPAHIRGMKNAAQAFATIQKAGSTFVSRGDESGTNQKEKALWQKAGIKPAGSSYWMVGQGMGATLTIADEKQAYTLCDRSTYLSRVKHLKIRLLVEGDPDLINYYSAIQVNPARFSSIKANLSHQLIEWLCSQEGQKLIGEYTVGGHTLYKPSCQTGK
jgi:tungstate transport system substrate-binding protein